MADRPVRIQAVLDASAMLSYARGHVHVGELLIDIADGGASMGLPTVALMAAYGRVGTDEPARARLALLATLPGVEVLPLGARKAAEASLVIPPVEGDLALAHAVSTAMEHRAYYLTTEPHLVKHVLVEHQIHEIPADDV